MDFGQPNAEIGWKMADGQLLFLVLTYRVHASSRKSAMKMRVELEKRCVHKNVLMEGI